ncbi:MAG TPA: hypothetical protein VJ754_10105 [Anaerolineae bacterium]|nr:hypothetical protein [Anaerolineae bacterium]
MAIRNIGRMTVGEVRRELKQGARFVVYEVVISLLVVTLRRPSPIYYVRPGQSPAQFHWPYTLLTLVLGWWGFPWGPAFTIGAVRDNLRGGRDVTARTLETILAAAGQATLPRSRRDGNA